MRRLLLLALILPVLFGCASSAAQARQAGTTVNLVAYSTPEARDGEAHLALRQHQPAGQGVSFIAVVRPVGLAGQGDRRRPARGHRLPLDRARHRHGRRRRPRLQELDEGAARRDRGRLGRRLRRAAGEPKAHPQLEGPDQAGRPGRDAGSVPLRVGEVERPRRLRRGAQGGQEQQAGDPVRDEALQERRLAGLVRLERREHVLLRQGRRPHHVRERGLCGLRRR